MYLFVSWFSKSYTYLVFFYKFTIFYCIFPSIHIHFSIILFRASSCLGYTLFPVQWTYFSRVHSIAQADCNDISNRCSDDRAFSPCSGQLLFRYIAHAMYAAKDYFIAHFRSAALVCDRYKRGILIFLKSNWFYARAIEKEINAALISIFYFIKKIGKLKKVPRIQREYCIVLYFIMLKKYFFK